MPKNITIQKVLRILLHRLPIILLAGVVFGLGFYIYTSIAIKPTYKTSSMIYIQNYGKQNKGNTDDADAANDAKKTTVSPNQSNNETAQKIFNSDLAGSSALASNCVTLFQNSNDVTSYYNGCSVDMSVTEGTFYITISVSGRDPKKCANVANIVAEKCGTVFYARFPYGTIGTVREADAPSTPVSPNKLQNTIIGVVVGLVIACIIAILLELIDTTIKSDDDLSAAYKVPVFAEIPDFESSGR